MKAFLNVLWWLYALACIAALMLIPASANGWFGITPDPLSAVFAIVLAMPWSLKLGALPENSPVLGIVAMGVAMAVNLLVLFLLGRWLFARKA